MNPSSSNIVLLDHAFISPGENARTYFDPLALESLKLSIREHGVKFNILVTPDPNVEGKYLLCAGERRWRATGDLLADLEKEGNTELLQARRHIKAEVLPEADAAKAFELGAMENLQRENITPLEEADAFYALERRLNPATGQKYTHEEIALIAGKLTRDHKPDAKHVRTRLKLRNAPDAVLQEVNAKNIAPSVGELIGRVPDAKSRAELAELVLHPEEQQIPLNYEQTKALIKDRFMISLRGCGFDQEDAELVPVEYKEESTLPDDGSLLTEQFANEVLTKVRVAGGACTDCPFRSGNNAELKEELAGGSREGKRGGTSGVATDLCSNPSCFRKKQDSVWMQIRRHAEAKGQKCIDGDAARKIFSGYEGQLAYDSDYQPSDATPRGQIVNWKQAPKWGELMKGTDVKLVVVRNPHTNAPVKLVPTKEVIEAVRTKAKAEKKKCIFDKPEEQKVDPAKAAAEKAKHESAAKIERKSRELVFDAFADKLKLLKATDAAAGKLLAHVVFRGQDSYDVPELLAVHLGLKEDDTDYIDDEKAWEEIDKRITQESKSDPHAWLRWSWLIIVAKEIDEAGLFNPVAKDGRVAEFAKAIGVDVKKACDQAKTAVAATDAAAKAEGSQPKAKSPAKAKPASKKGKK